MSEQKKPARWYIVRNKSDGASCLVEASNPAQAFRRAGEHYCTARPATVDEALRMARDGRDVIYAPNIPEQLDLEEQTNSVVAGDTVAAPAKEGSEPEASETSGASGPLKCDGNHGGPPCQDPECWAREPYNNDNSPALARTVRAPPRKASEVFGVGFGPQSAADQID